ncbi:YscO family type III secretion system apparatus protein [Pseudomonas sp. F16(2018)]|uniref:type III secretion system stalk subunit SctO n=1 Tax=Pseudomonas sp. F16(2018) TaxID=2093746 RepID=UPI0015A99670|nr:YscO family type III secretion system apparatus protein [Pseudomonas sp. F16(2018)]
MPLTALAKIKQRRLQRAEREARSQLALLQATEQAEAQAVEAHLAFCRGSREEQQRLFAAHVGQLTDCRALEHWRRQVGLLGEREASLHGQVVACKAALARQYTAHQQAQAQLAQTRKKRDSFVQLRDQAHLRATRLAERRQEFELEEHCLHGGLQP